MSNGFPTLFGREMVEVVGIVDIARNFVEAADKDDFESSLPQFVSDFKSHLVTLANLEKEIELGKAPSPFVLSDAINRLKGIDKDARMDLLIDFGVDELQEIVRKLGLKSSYPNDSNVLILDIDEWCDNEQMGGH